MSWYIETSTGKLYTPQGYYVATGYAGGNMGKNPEGVNNPALQDQHCIGPLPQGLYTMGTPVEGLPVGAFAIPLTPDPANTMYGRSGFFCHGDNQAMNESASEGCFVMGRNIREQLASSSDQQIQVVAVFGGVMQ